MHEMIRQMLEKYQRRSLDETVRALREVLQELALLGLWRRKFFEKAAFYGDTALRVLYDLDRFSEDLDFSLLRPDPAFSFERYLDGIEKELHAFGFDVRVEVKEKSAGSAIKSAFLKADTFFQLLAIETPASIVEDVRKGQVIKVKFEVDVNPPPGFETDVKYLLQPIPFAVRVFSLPDLFAGKMHAVLCRTWQTRVKGRDWYDLVWYAGRYPELHLVHLEARMRQSGHWSKEEPLTERAFRDLAFTAVEKLDVEQARKEVERYVLQPRALEVWSKEFFHDVMRRITLV